MKKKIGFVYFEQIYHIHHFIGIANELSKQSDTIVDILTYKNEHKYLFKILNLLNAKNINVKQLNTRVDRIVIEKIKKRIIPSSLFLYKKNKKNLLTYDALIFTDLNADYLIKKKGSNLLPKFIFVFHGAGDGSYIFQEKLNNFDLLLIQGENFKNRLKKNNILKSSRKIIGYPKFDVVKKELSGKQLFKNDAITVIYNPHFNKEITSWHIDGKNVLDFFYKNKEYNLIFIPHLKLFKEKGISENPNIDKKYYEADNIIIDIDSANLVNMTYTFHADIYIGDVSSQVYEFIIKPRPCIFINSHKIAWHTHKNYYLWNLGQVIENTINLNETIQKAIQQQEKFEGNQKKLFEYNFDIQTDKTSSLRGSEAIIDFLENQKK